MVSISASSMAALVGLGDLLVLEDLAGEVFLGIRTGSGAEAAAACWFSAPFAGLASTSAQFSSNHEVSAALACSSSVGGTGTVAWINLGSLISTTGYLGGD